MSVHASLRNHFLIAMPSMADSPFNYSVVYICEHSPEGAMGIVINIPLNIHLDDVLRNMQIPAINDALSQTPILAGGPLQQERGFVIHRTTTDKWESSLALTNSISITTSKDILLAMANNKGPKDAIIALGYSGWEAGQLERELTENTWLCGPADPRVLFDTPPDNRWRAAGALLGINMDFLSHEVGHA